jgi:putative nucleotidyltransferase with HDIG domain
VSVASRTSQELPFRLQPRPWEGLTERARPKGPSLDASASRRAGPFVLSIGVLALVACIIVGHGDLQLDVRTAGLATILVALGLGSELLGFRQTKQSAGSIALIPFAAAALVAPHTLTIVLILGVELIVQSTNKRPWLKAGFNLAQISLGFALGILAYRTLGGIPFLQLKGLTLFQCARLSLLPTTLLVGAVGLVNSFSVSAVIALTSDKRLLETWSVHTKKTLPVFLLVILVSFYLTWLSVNLGFVGTIGIAVPMVAVRQLYRTTIELTNVTEELLDLMVAAIEARDPYTSGHSQRVARASEVIAKAMELNAKDAERVTIAALLHDVGKIDEQFAPILAKEGRLTPEEWSIMKKHPIRGAELVGLLSSLQDLVRPVRHHHENWDGTGYPDGLKGEGIPLASRIIMFADTLDAITTDRPYRKALTIAEARAEFIKFRGRQFDPTICDRILTPAVWDELYRATDKNDLSTQALSYRASRVS